MTLSATDLGRGYQSDLVGTTADTTTDMARVPTADMARVTTQTDQGLAVDTGMAMEVTDIQGTAMAFMGMETQATTTLMRTMAITELHILPFIAHTDSAFTVRSRTAGNILPASELAFSDCRQARVTQWTILI